MTRRVATVVAVALGVAWVLGGCADEQVVVLENRTDVEVAAYDQAEYWLGSFRPGERRAMRPLSGECVRDLVLTTVDGTRVWTDPGPLCDGDTLTVTDDQLAPAGRVTVRNDTGRPMDRGQVGPRALVALLEPGEEVEMALPVPAGTCTVVRVELEAWDDGGETVTSAVHAPGEPVCDGDTVVVDEADLVTVPRG